MTPSRRRGDRPDHRQMDEERMDADHAAMTRTRRRNQQSNVVEMTIVAAAAILITISTAFSAWNTFELRKLQQSQAEERELILIGTECLVEQMADHRFSTSLSHRADATHHRYAYPVPPEREPAPTPGQLEESCATFVASTTSSSTTTSP